MSILSLPQISFPISIYGIYKPYTVVLDFIEMAYYCFKLSGKIAANFLANLHDRFVWNFLKGTKILFTHKNINVFFTDYV